METEPTLQELSTKLDAIYTSTEKTRVYFKWTLMATLVAFALPLLVALFVLPSFIASYTQSLSSLVQ
jgi:hypothetical protein|tara:strand:+ start:441375 stop:441575 length:201 start_codon:yes stop_codon:yes gene_type:complete